MSGSGRQERSRRDGVALVTVGPTPIVHRGHGRVTQIQGVSEGTVIVREGHTRDHPPVTAVNHENVETMTGEKENTTRRRSRQNGQTVHHAAVQSVLASKTKTVQKSRVVEGVQTGTGLGPSAAVVRPWTARAVNEATMVVGCRVTGPTKRK